MSWIEYNKETGDCFRCYYNGRKIKAKSTLKVGRPTSRKKYRYFQDFSSGKRKIVLVHRYAWQLHNGPIPKGMIIDHIDGDSLNNKLNNLRLVTKSGNALNPNNEFVSVQNGKSGERGVVLNQKTNKWKAQLTVNGRNYSKSGFDTVGEAIEARVKMEEKYVTL